MKIRRLSSALANQIAAGEVVERPASVVKELVENAIDAGATRITVEIEQGGTLSVKVTDDGEGMTPDDAELALERHATSKIQALDDLFHIRSFGFRGEALPSIASVSKLSLVTRTRDSQEATEVLVHGGEPAKVRPAGAAPGTSITVSELFFNVPARRKFLKSTATEAAHVGEVVLLAALARPQVTFTLLRDGRLAREHLRASSREERTRQAFGDERLAAVSGERGPLRLDAFLSAPERARAGATGLHLFVNDRPVRDRTLARAVAQSYGSVLEAGRYPIGAVYIDVAPELVDINVHPQKAEVRFTDARAVFDAVTRELHEGLARSFAIPSVGPTSHPWARAASRGPSSFGGSGASGFALTSPSPPPAAQRNASLPFGFSQPARTSGGAGIVPPDGELGSPAASPAPPLSGEAPFPSLSPSGSTPLSAGGRPQLTPSPAAVALSAQLQAGPERALSEADIERAAASRDLFTLHAPVPAFYGSLRFLAQLRGVFLLCEGEDGLYVLDQHAAAERVTFDRLRRAYASRQVAMQKLLLPEVIDLRADEVAALEGNLDLAQSLGLELRAAGVSAVAVHAVPQLLKHATPERMVRDLAAELTRDAARPLRGAIDLIVATMACHGSLRAGDRIEPEEARALLVALDEVDFSGHCPHGRPVVTRLPFSELERRVGR